jgi:uncharacterized protein YlxW (UPF0749 family)
MKMRHALILAVLLISLPALVSCNLFGPSKEELRQQQIEAYQQALDAYQKSQDEYYQSLEKALNEYNKSYAEWQQQNLQQNLQEVPGGGVVIVTANETQP